MPSLDPFLARARIAYFSMEIAVRPEMHTYSGGLGILARDRARSCADLKLPSVFVTLVSRAGYFRQRIDADRRQIEDPDPQMLAIAKLAVLTASLISALVGLMVLHAAIRRSASAAVASAQPAELPR